MDTLINIIVLGAIWGSLYSLIAVGFTLIFGVAGIINLSHRAFYMLGAYLAYTFMTLLNINVLVAALMAVAGTAIIGMLIDRFGIRPMRERHVYVLIITLAFAWFFQELMYAFYGPHGKHVKSFI
ncbi:MAG: branched-chain amino acid ABC transporter permease, partial [Planctomycetota bacterium]